eukprot:566566-Rhodomonas_salina.1
MRHAAFEPWKMLPRGVRDEKRFHVFNGRQRLFSQPSARTLKDAARKTASNGRGREDQGSRARSESGPEGEGARRGLAVSSR